MTVQTPDQSEALTAEQRAAVASIVAGALAPINERLDHGAQKMNGLADGVAAVRGELEKNTATTNEVRELLAIGKGGLRVLGWIGGFVKWVGGIAGAVVAIVAFISWIKTGGQVPPPKP